MLELINKIQRVNKKIVFVGGLSEIANGIKSKTKDIDIVINDIKGLEVFGIIEIFVTKSPISKTGKRAFIKRDDYNIDIFIEEDEIDYFIKNGIKYQTLKSMEKHYNESIKKSAGKMKEILENKLKNIQK